MVNTLVSKIKNEFKRIPELTKKGVESYLTHPKYMVEEFKKTTKEDKVAPLLGTGVSLIGEPYIYYQFLNFSTNKYLSENPDIGALTFSIPFILRGAQFLYYSIKDNKVNEQKINTEKI